MLNTIWQVVIEITELRHRKLLEARLILTWKEHSDGKWHDQLNTQKMDVEGIIELGRIA